MGLGRVVLAPPERKEFDRRVRSQSTVSRVWRQFVLSAEPVEFHDRFVLQPHSSEEIRMRFDGPPLIVPRDTRELAFQTIDFQWKESGQ
jgi:hypothetical protein